MFGHQDTIELSPGESHDEFFVSDGVDFYELTREWEAEDWEQPVRHSLPAGFERLGPGLFQAAIAGSVDRTRLNGHDAVRLMKVEAGLASHFEAGKLATMVEVAHSPAGGPDAPVVRDTEELEYASFEIGTALNLTRRAAENELDLALSLSGKLKRVWDKMRKGLLDLRRIRVFDDQLGHLPDDTIKEVSDKILPSAGELTTGQLRARLGKLVMESDPEGAVIGYEEGFSDRKFVTYPNPDGTANQGVQSIAPNDAAAISNKIHLLALGLKSDSETRTIDQLKADVYVDLLLGRADSTGSNGVGGTHLKVDLATLARLSDTPGELGGYGAVIADIARKTAVAQAGGTWQFTVTDDNGNIVINDVTRRRPTATLKRHIEAEYQTCVAPGCRMAAYDCDLDHRRPYASGGSTTSDNMAPLCRYHHMAKHHAPWELARLPNGDHHWTSPLGHTYIKPRAPPSLN